MVSSGRELVSYGRPPNTDSASGDVTSPYELVSYGRPPSTASASGGVSSRRELVSYGRLPNTASASGSENGSLRPGAVSASEDLPSAEQAVSSAGIPPTVSIPQSESTIESHTLQSASVFGIMPPAAPTLGTAPRMNAASHQPALGSSLVSIEPLAGLPASTAAVAKLPSATTDQAASTTIMPSSNAVLHPSGDLFVYHNDFATPLLLCSKAFALLCKPWAKMVEYRTVMGPKESQKDEGMKIDLSDDDPIALSILLHISHLRFEMLPSFLSLKQLFALSVLTDKYEATRMVRPWIAHWLSDWNFQSIETKVANVWIAWEFGLLEDFKRIASALVLDAEIKDDSDRLFYNSKELPGEVPPGLIESALEVRRKVICQLLDIAYAYLDRCRLPPPPVYTSTFTTAPFRSGLCQASAGTHACHVSMCGSLLLGLQEIGLYTRRDTAPCNLSINKLATALQGLKIFHFSLASPGVHAGCNPIPELKRKVKEVLANIPSAVTTAHAAHIERQKKLLGGDKSYPTLSVPFQVASGLFQHTR